MSEHSDRLGDALDPEVVPDGQSAQAALAQADFDLGLREHAVQAVRPQALIMRERNLANFCPKLNDGDLEVWRRVKPVVVAAVMGTEFSSADTDSNRMGRAAQFAMAHYRTYGQFSSTDFIDTKIEHFLDTHKRDLTQRSRSTYRSTLRQLGNTGKVRRATSRERLLHGYEQTEWDRMFRAARFNPELVDLSRHMALTGGAGLRPAEAHRAAVDWVVLDGGAVSVRVPLPTGEFREIPVFDHYADVLRTAVNELPTGAYLVLPSYRNRTNVGWRLCDGPKQQYPWVQRYSGDRARVTWLNRIVTSPIPAATVSWLAGVGRGAHTLSDAICHLPVPDAQTARRHVEQARSQSTPTTRNP